MEIRKLIQAVSEIVEEANILKNKHTAYKNVPVNYACLFAQDKMEYEDLFQTAKKMGKIIMKTETGPVFNIDTINTVSGKLKLLKIRLPEKTHKERGDADFTVTDFYKFKKDIVHKKEFKLIKKENPDFEMIELLDKDFTVRAYFSNPPLDKILKIKY